MNQPASVRVCAKTAPSLPAGPTAQGVQQSPRSVVTGYSTATAGSASPASRSASEFTSSPGIARSRAQEGRYHCSCWQAGPRSIADLSAATAADGQSLYRVLRALASRGLFRDDGDKRFSLTPLAAPLRKDAAHNVRPQALWSGSEAYRRTWGDLAYSVRTGEPAFDHVYGKPFF
jgi:hypothetical protein